MAYRRLVCFEKKLFKYTELKHNISKQLTEYVDKGCAEKLDSRDLDSGEQSWYLPIFVVGKQFIVV